MRSTGPTDAHRRSAQGCKACTGTPQRGCRTTLEAGSPHRHPAFGVSQAQHPGVGSRCCHLPRAASGDEAPGDAGVVLSQQPTVGSPWGCGAGARAARGCSGGPSTLKDPRSRAQLCPRLALAPQPREDRCPPRPTLWLGRVGATPGRSPGLDKNLIMYGPFRKSQ